MFTELCVGSFVAAAGMGLVVVPPVKATNGGVQQPSQRPTMLAGMFLRIVDSNPHRFVKRFAVRTASMGDVEIELAMTAIITRNGQPALLSHLKPGDQTLVMLMGSQPPMAARVEATGP